MGKKYI
jgi:hypothetical protein